MAITILLWVLLAPGPFILDRVLSRVINAENLAIPWLFARDSVVLIPLIPIIFFARAVSYRRRDCLVWVLPPLGMVLSLVVFWRLAFLPYRDWMPRRDEADEWERLEVPGSARILFKEKGVELYRP